MDLVDKKELAVARTEIGHRRQLLAGPDPAEWVVRAAEQVRADAVIAERPVERLEVQVVTAAGTPQQRRLDDMAPGEADPEEERRVHRGVDDNPRPWRRDRHDHLGDTSHHVGDGEDPGRIRRPSQPVGGERGEGLAQFALVPVAGVADRDGRPDCLLDGLRQVEVHLGDESGKDVIGVGAPLKALPPPERLQRAISEHGIHVTDGNPAASDC